MSQKRLEIQSKRQHIRLWFECYQICLSDKKYSNNLKKSKSFYKEWWNVSDIHFDIFWKDKKYLFDKLIVREVRTISKNPNTINLNSPLNQNISTIIKEVKKIVKSKKSDKSNIGKYDFSQKQIKGIFHYINLEIYKIFLKLDQPPINRNFLIEIRKDFDNRPKSLLKKSVLNLPSLDQFQTRFKKNVDLDDVIRVVRRQIKSVEKTLMNVSLGKFP